VKYRVLTAIAFLLLGAIVNVAVAWGVGLAFASPTERYRFGDAPSHEGGFWRFTEHRAAGRTALWWLPEHERLTPKRFLPVEYLATPPSWTTVDWSKGPDRILYDANVAATVEDACGWPCRAMLRRADIWIGSRNGRGTSESKTKWTYAVIVPQAPSAMSILEAHEAYRALALSPIWPGFAINTVFYAALLWLLFAAPFALRRRRRINGGLCPKCAYDLRATQAGVCPECGATR